MNGFEHVMRRALRMGSTANKALLCCVGILCSFLPGNANALLIQFNYDYDTSKYFEDQKRKDVLVKAASAFGGFTDVLTAIEPKDENTWSLTFDHPSERSEDPEKQKEVTLSNVAIPANTLLVYVGAMDLGFDPASVTLAEASFGGGGALSGSPEWSQTVQYRGQSAHPEDDFGPWGGSLTFNLNDSLKWYFDLASSVPADRFDALTVATHELAHILGFGSAPSWNQHLFEDPPRFDGLYSERANPKGVTVPVDEDLSHWHESVGEHLMVASIPKGKRIAFSELDRGALCDAGWTHAECNLASEPNSLALLCGVAWIVWMRNRWRGLATCPPRPAS